ncbi:alpha-tocopherol transfer protein-like [Schistocerca cancellata]|uniref:alpha-tocopherol transfer protein-like n=1 Tax=Schistocerca cancellata TaxID=274614 RepID=UPI002118643B|nr:alpha-tocopherol transfer protein-like [Schistocerca cancellata]XP_049784683.1 alpha-tocopherol transfer protein-like [Schistocerca cancellata]
MKTGLPTPEQVAYVRKQLGTSENDIKVAIMVIRKWLKMQPHLPQNIDDARLERMYINCKCSLERVKTSVDAYFSLKNRYPELLMNRNPREIIGVCKKFITMFPMPRLTDGCLRVSVTTNICENPDDYDPLVMSRAILLWSELMLREDYSLGDIMILDMKNVQAGHVLKTGIGLLRGLEMIYRGAYCRRIKALHFVNAPKVMDMIMTLVRAALPEKIRKRVMTHLPGSNTLFDHLPRSMVPNELGGTGGPAEELAEDHRERYWPLVDWFMEQDQFVSDESMRPHNMSCGMENGFSVDGSFKKLCID